MRPIDSTDAYLAVRCLLVANDLERLDRLAPEDRQQALADATGLLDLLSEVLLEPDPSTSMARARATGRTRPLPIAC